jgi:hypothetical protein
MKTIHNTHGKSAIRSILILTTAIVTLALASCGGAGGGGNSPADVTGDPAAAPGTEYGSIRLNTVQPGFSASTVFPDMGEFDAIDVYRVSLVNGPGSNQSATGAAGANGDLSTPVVFDELIPGEWTIEARGYEGAVDTGTLRVEGSATVVVVAGAQQNPAVIAYPISDESVPGSWSLALAWPKILTFDGYSVDTSVSSVEYRIDEGAWQSIESLDFADDGSLESIAIGDAVTPGSFWLSIRLNHEDRPYTQQFVYGERWYVYSNLETAKSINLATDELNYGGGAGITVTIESPTDLETFFDGTEDSVVMVGDENFQITAAVASADAGSYSWRLNGVTDTAQAGNATYTLPTPSAADAGKVHVITLEVSVNGKVYSGTHRVRVEA